MTYVVKSGDSLSAIARDELDNIDLWSSIAKLNGINPPYVIVPGQILELPPKGTTVTPPVATPPAAVSSWSSNSTIVFPLVAVAIIAVVIITKKKKKKS